MRHLFLIPALLVSTALATESCKSVYYDAMDKLGYEKRHILKSRLEETAETQKETKEQFEDTLSELRALYGSSGSDLEKRYDDLKEENEESKEKAKELRERINKVESVAKDMFKEWSEEIGLIENADLKEKSRHKLNETRKRYEDMHKTLVNSAKSIEPVLKRFNDQVLFIKHNLNAEAFGTLEAESKSIETDVAKLVAELNASMAETDKFIKSLE